MTRFLSLACLFVIGCVVALNSVVEAQEKKDPPACEGTWKGTAFEPDDIPFENFILELKDGKFKISIGEGDELEVFASGDYSVNTKVSPNQMKLDITEGDRAGEAALCIFKMEDDNKKLVWCANEPGSEGYPEEFAGDMEGGTIMVTFERKKK